MTRLIGWGLACAAIVVGCGGSSGGGGGGGGGGATVSGTLGGQAVATTDQVGLVGTETTNGTTVAFAAAVITNLPGACAIAQSNGNPRNSQTLVLEVGEEGTAVPPGTYSIGGTTTVALATFVAQDDTCTQTAQDTGTSGTITITTASSTEVAGSFDVTFNTGDHLTGTFSAPVCDASLTDDGGTSACGS
jgi:hypothetical protein